MKAHLRLVLLWAVSALAAAAQLLPMAIRLHLKDGRKLDCVLVQRTAEGILVERRVGTTRAREPHRLEQIDAIQFPLPSILTSINVRALRDKQALEEAVQAVEQQYTAWQAFADIRGNHLPGLLRLYGALLERQKAYGTAARMYEQLQRIAVDEPTRLHATKRLAVCTFWTSTNGAALVALTNFVATAEDDAERAEFLFYAGVSYAQRGEHVAALFTLLKNPVFYSMHGAWEPRSLTAALASFAALERREEFITTCATLTQRFERTVWAAIAQDRLHALTCGTNLTALASITNYLAEEP
ncbi:MAG: hypothetical protein N2595_03945 [bacterium]|nr:hypothetical protein [bacterium]